MMRYCNLGIYAAALLFAHLCYSAQSETELQGSNVCTRLEIYNVTVNVTELKPYQVRESYFCFTDFKLKCSRYRIVMKSIVSQQVLEKKKPIEECCEGFVISPNKTNCIPVCQNNCEHGTCTSPNICKCDDNYGGPYCNKTCPTGKFGEFCTENCQCENGSPCDPYDGQCKCLAGWTGVDCS